MGNSNYTSQKPAISSFEYGFQSDELQEMLWQEADQMHLELHNTKPKKQTITKDDILWIDKYKLPIFSLFAEKFPDLKSILYACSGYDPSPSMVFDNVTYLDADYDAISPLGGKGLKAVMSTVEDYFPEQLHDALLLYNPQSINNPLEGINPEIAARHIKNKGIVLANNYWGTAAELYNSPNYSFIGKFELSQSDKAVFSQFEKPGKALKFIPEHEKDYFWIFENLALFAFRKE